MPSLMFMYIDPEPTDDFITIQMTVRGCGEGNALVGEAPIIGGYDLFAITDARGYTWQMVGNKFYLLNAPSGDIRITATYEKQR